MKGYDTTLMLMSLKYARKVLLEFGDIQKNGDYILDGRIYTLFENRFESRPLKN